MRVTRGLQEKFINLGLSECISSFLKQKLECLNRTQKKSLNFDFLEGNIQRKVGSEFMWNSWQISVAARSYWEPCCSQLGGFWPSWFFASDDIAARNIIVYIGAKLKEYPCSIITIIWFSKWLGQWWKSFKELTEVLTARITFLFINWIFIYNIIVIAILTLTSAIDFKVPTRHTLVLETKYSIVSLIRNLKY